MYNVSKKFIKKLLQDKSRSIVGRLCKRIELLDDNASEENKSKILKAFVRELIYENFRDLENEIKCYNYGQTYEKHKIFETPSED